MNEQKILSACRADRQAFERISPYVDEQDFTPMAWHWYGHISDYYDRDPDAKWIDVELVLDRGLRKANERQRDTLQGYWTDLPVGVSSANVTVELLELKREAKAMELAATLTNPGADDVSRMERMSEYQDLLQATELNGSELEWADIERMDIVLDLSLIHI